MFTKLLFIVVSLTVIAMVLLGLRQQRIQLMHEMANLHGQMDATRRKTWDLQVRIAEQVEPAQLRRALDRHELQMDATAMDTPEPPAGETDPRSGAGRQPSEPTRHGEHDE